ncbi:tetratricopeptide repeat protein [Roseateles sp. DAIF2]|uniref:tetratricopeptide repeat protein n=1 Tax=Roseateles sp. DAIF2 TaxID=2714952 RepID=UPI0018A309C4|nr:tetratricopeptide repeat protein [Roseateles sp. DAIF2]QPF74536.1 tetratricopeptide repeat protein [Roseateles sp. DAIF2]
MTMEIEQPPSSPPAPSALAAEAALAAAREALQACRWDEARQQAEAALAAGLTGMAQGEALLLLALSHWWLGHLGRVHRPALRAAVLPAQPHVRIRALNLAALALGELGLAHEALPLAQQALELARQPGQHEQLSGALSCTAHVHARLGDLENAELLHMQALSMARESAQPAQLQQAYCNLLLSFALAQDELLEQQRPQAAAAAPQRGLHYVSHARSLLRDPRLDDERRAALELAIGHLLMLLGRLDEAEPLLRAAIANSERLGSDYTLRSACHSLAELLRRRGEPAAALALLRAQPEPPSLGLRLARRRCLLACLIALGEEHQAVEEALAQELAQRDAMRRQARQSLDSPSQFGPLDGLPVSMR